MTDNAIEVKVLNVRSVFTVNETGKNFVTYTANPFLETNGRVPPSMEEIKDLSETTEQLPIRYYTDFVHYPINKVTPEKAEELLKKGYKKNLETMHFEKSEQYAYTITDDVWRFIKLEKEALNRLTYEVGRLNERNEGLRTNLHYTKNCLDDANNKICRLKYKLENTLWNRFKRLFTRSKS